MVQLKKNKNLKLLKRFQLDVSVHLPRATVKAISTAALTYVIDCLTG